MDTPLPLIGWKACEQQFYLDGLPITVDVARSHWETILKRHRDPSVKATAIFLPFAAKRMHEIMKGGAS